MPVSWAWRARLLGLALVGAWVAIVFCHRLYQLQIIEGAVHRQRSWETTTLSLSIPAPRGRIIDATGQVLAANEPRYAVSVTPGALLNGPATLQNLASALHANALHLAHVVSARERWAPLEPVVVERSLSADQVSAVAALQERRRGVTLDIRPQRRYPRRELASHVLGYVGQISEEEYARLKRAGYRPNDVIGKSGLEEQYDRWLRGRAGHKRDAVDAMGHVVGPEDTTWPVPGDDIHLSLNIDMQTFAEERLQKTLDQLSAANGEKTAGAVVMMEVGSGRILALASRPNYDPRLFAKGIGDNDFARLMKDPLHPLLSRAYQASYPPGSTFKPIDACASLENGICTPKTVFFCSGVYRGFHCFVRSGHGFINFTEAIAQSCDVTFYRLGDLLGIHRMAKNAMAFGLGHRTGIDLPDEQGGLFATPSWKRKVFKEDWQWYDTINMAIGQGMMDASPLQMAVAVSAIANGGYVFAPHLVDRIESFNHRVRWVYHPRPLRRVPVKPQWLAAVRVGMEGVVDHGTAAGIKSRIVSIAGKTGTAEAVPTADNPYGRNHTWFVSYAPTDHPQITTVVLVVKAGGFGSEVSAPVARDCIEYWYTHVRPRSKTAAVSRRAHPVPRP